MAGRITSRDIRIATPYRPTSAEVEILRALAMFDYLTVEQIVRLFYKPGMLTTVQTRLKRLYEHKYCERRELPQPPMERGGRGAYTYCLGANGRKFCAEELSLAVPSRFRPSEIPRVSHLNHLVACCDVYVSAHLLCQKAPQGTLQLERLVTDRALRGLGKPVTVNGRATRVTPDGWLSIISRVGTKRYRDPIALEVDLGSEKQTRWRAKIQGLLAWMDQVHPQLFGTPKVTVAIVTPQKPQHARVLCAWTETALVELGHTYSAENFLFSSANPASVSPEAFFLAPTWLQLFKPQRIPLIEVEASAG